MPLSYPQTDGARMSFASIEAKIAGKIFFIHACDYSRERARNAIYLNHPDPIGKTRGTNKYKADAEMLVEEYNLLIAQLGGAGYGDKFFDVYITGSENGNVYTDVLRGCTLDSTESTNTQGDDALMRKITLNPVKVLFNGIDDVTTPLQAPPG